MYARVVLFTYPFRAKYYHNFFSSFFQRMLRFEQHRRITACEALNHPYFKEFGYVPLEIGTSLNQSTSSASNASTPVSVNSCKCCSCDDSRTSTESPDKQKENGCGNRKNERRWEPEMNLPCNSTSATAPEAFDLSRRIFGIEIFRNRVELRKKTDRRQRNGRLSLFDIFYVYFLFFFLVITKLAEFFI